MIKPNFPLPPMAMSLLPMTLVLLCGCGIFGGDDDEDVQRTRLDLSGDYQGTLLVIPDHCDVHVSGTVRFLDERDSSLVIGSDVTFLMEDNAQLSFFSAPVVAQGTPPIMKALETDARWRRLTLEGTRTFAFDGWSFQQGREGVLLNGSKAQFTECSFDDMLIYGIYNTAGDSLLINDCQFEDCGTALYVTNGNTIVNRTRFIAGVDGQYGACNQEAGLVLEDCYIEGYASAGVWMVGDGQSASYNTIEHCHFYSCSDGVYNGTGRTFNFQFNIVENCVWHGVRIRLQNTGMPLLIANNHLLPCTQGWPLRFDNGPDLDVTGNWWGSADSSAVAALVYDSHLNPEGNGFAVYTPFATGPILGVGPRD